MANEITTRQQTPLQRFNGVMKDTRTQEYLSSVLGNKKDQFVTTPTGKRVKSYWI